MHITPDHFPIPILSHAWFPTTCSCTTDTGATNVRKPLESFLVVAGAIHWQHPLATGVHLRLFASSLLRSGTLVACTIRHPIQRRYASKVSCVCCESSAVVVATRPQLQASINAHHVQVCKCHVMFAHTLRLLLRCGTSNFHVVGGKIPVCPQSVRRCRVSCCGSHPVSS